MTSRKWLRVFANMGLTFVTVMAGNLTFDRMMAAGIPFWKMLGASTFSALLFALIVLFRELKSYTYDPPPSGGEGTGLPVPKSRAKGHRIGHILCLFGI